MICQVAGFLTASELSEKPRCVKLDLKIKLLLLSDIFVICVTAVVIMLIDFVIVFIHYLLHLLFPLLRVNRSTLFWDSFNVGRRAQLGIDLLLLGVCRRN